MYYRIFVYYNYDLILISNDKYDSLEEANYICKESAKAFEKCNCIDFKVKKFCD